MNLDTVKFAVNRGALVLRKHSPQILTAAGIAGGIVSAVLVGKASMELSPILDDMELEIEDLKRVKALQKEDPTPQELGTVYGVYGLRIAKLYAPAVTVGVASIACVISAQGIMHKRNAAIAAAYTALERGFNEYRTRVADALGEDKERELRYAVNKVEKIKDDEGNEIEVAHHNPNGISIYARFFDETNPNWQRNAFMNRTFVQQQQNWLNDKLQANGHVFLNEVYDCLGMERTPAGQVVGWLREGNGDGDGYIDFGLFQADNERVRSFVNGQEYSILLDFNVDGIIYDKI